METQKISVDKKLYSSTPIGRTILGILLPFIVLFVGTLPAFFSFYFIISYLDYTNIFHLFIIPLLIIFEFLFFIVIEIVLAAFIIKIFKLKYHEGEYDVCSKDKNLFKMFLFYSLYQFVFKFIDLFPYPYLKKAYLKLFGLKIGKTSELSSMGVCIMDPCLTEIGENSYLGAFSILTANLYQYDKIILGKIKIGNNCMISGEVTIHPGVVVEDDVIVGSHTLILRDTVLKKGKTYVGIPAKELIKSKK